MSSRPTPALDRRMLLAGAGATATLAATGFSPAALAQQGLKLGQAEAFGFDGLKLRARDLAGRPYEPPPPRLPGSYDDDGLRHH